jgi:hypothetical protein
MLPGQAWRASGWLSADDDDTAEKHSAFFIILIAIMPR